MKKIILSLSIMTLGLGLVAQTKLSDVAKLDNETINLGQIKQGNPTTAKFIVTNISTQPLIIEQANPTCETVPSVIIQKSQ
jgi:malic enzyme